MFISILDQIDASNEEGHFMVALMAALAIPDIAGALESSDGEATRSRYAAWFDRWIAPKYMIANEVIFDGHTCYYYRCAALHQARSTHPKLGYSRVLFIEPGIGGSSHKNILNDALNLDVQVLCADITNGARDWWDSRSPAVEVRKNLAQSMQRYPDGLSPYLRGVSVIG